MGEQQSAHCTQPSVASTPVGETSASCTAGLGQLWHSADARHHHHSSWLHSHQAVGREPWGGFNMVLFRWAGDSPELLTGEGTARKHRGTTPGKLRQVLGCKKAEEERERRREGLSGPGSHYQWRNAHQGPLCMQCAHVHSHSHRVITTRL